MNYRTIATCFWSDPKIEDEFTPEDKYFYLYLLTNSHTNICGCYEISMSSITKDTGYNKDTIEKLLDRFERIHNVIRYNNDTKEVLLLNWYKYNWSSSDKLITSVERVAKHIKHAAFRDYIERRISGDNINIDTVTVTETVTESDTDTVIDVSIGYGYPMDTLSEKEKKNRFIAPTIEEVKSYINEKKYKVNADEWFNYYASNGWKVGKNKMVNWKACIAKWNAGNNSSNTNKHNSYDYESLEKELLCK